MHRNVSLVLLATASALILTGSISSAAASGGIQGNYCLQGRQSGYPGNCEFSTYHQCLATASGTAEGCGINPMRAYARPRRDGYRGD